MGYFDPHNAVYHNVYDVGTLTIGFGAITLPVIPVGAGIILARVDTQAAAASDILDSIATTGAVAEGTQLILRSVSSARDVIVNSSTSANLLLDNDSDATLGTTDDRAILIRNDAGGWSGRVLSSVAALAINTYRARVDAPKALANDTSTQPLFPAANDALAVAAGVIYGFRLVGRLTTGAGSASVSLIVGGTATFTTFNAVSHGINAASATAAASSMNNIEAATTHVIVPAGTGVNKRFTVEGEFEVNAAGTVIPSIAFSAAPGGGETVNVGTFFEAWPIGTNPAVAIGPWA